MDDKAFQNKIVAYLDRAEQLREAAEKNASLEEKKELFTQVLSSMGLSVEEQQALSREGQQNLQAAQNAFEMGSYAECERMASRAHQLLPFEERPIVLLLQLHSRGKIDQPKLAEDLRQELRVLNPEHPVLHAPVPVRAADQESIRVYLVISLFFLLFSLTAVGFVFMYSPSDDPSDQNPPVVKPIKEETQRPKAEPQDIEANADSIEMRVLGLEVPGLSILDQGTRIERYPQSYAVKWKAIFHNQSQAAVSKLNLELELRDAAGDVILTKDKKIFLETAFPSQPGLDVGIEQLFYVDKPELVAKSPQSIQVRVTELELSDPVEIETHDMDLQWAEGLTPRAQLSIALEAHPPNYSDLLKVWFYQSALRMTYSGQYPLHKLKVQLEARNAAGELIDSHSFYPITSNMPALQPKSPRLYQHFSKTSEKPVDYSITVLEIE